MQKSVYSGQLAGPVYTRIRIVGHCGACCCVQWSAKMTTVHSLEWIYVKDGGDFCLVGSEAGKYAGQLLKAGSAAQPKGCSARYVPSDDKVILNCQAYKQKNLKFVGCSMNEHSEAFQ